MSYDGLNDFQTVGMPYLFPGLMNEEDAKESYLNSLDSDMREYVKRHTDAECSRSDLEECVNELKGFH